MWAYLAECDKLLVHTRQAAIENINTIDECRSKIVRNKEFSIAICRPYDDIRQLKTLFQEIFNPVLSIVKSIFHCRLSGVLLVLLLIYT